MRGRPPAGVMLLLLLVSGCVRHRTEQRGGKERPAPVRHRPRQPVDWHQHPPSHWARVHWLTTDRRPSACWPPRRTESQLGQTDWRLAGWRANQRFKSGKNAMNGCEITFYYLSCHFPLRRCFPLSAGFLRNRDGQDAPSLKSPLQQQSQRGPPARVHRVSSRRRAIGEEWPAP